MSPEVGETVVAESPQESAGVPANTRECARKKANREWLALMYWWSRRESNPRPQVLYDQFYMRSRSIWISMQA